MFVSGPPLHSCVTMVVYHPFIGLGFHGRYLICPWSTPMNSRPFVTINLLPYSTMYFFPHALPKCYTILAVLRINSSSLPLTLPLSRSPGLKSLLSRAQCFWASTLHLLGSLCLTTLVSPNLNIFRLQIFLYQS